LPAALAAGDLFFPVFKSPDTYTLRAYSEFMPSPRFGVRPYEPRLSSRQEILSEPYWEKIRSSSGNFRIAVQEEEKVLRPGLQYLAEHLLEDLAQLGAGESAGGAKLKGIPAALLAGNPYWDDRLVGSRGPLVLLSQLALTKTQDDKGQTRWTVLPSAEEESLFLKSLPADAEKWWRSLLARAGIPVRKGIRYLSERGVEEADVVITFLPIASWPEWLKKKFFAGEVAVVPHPLTRIFADSPPHRELVRKKSQAAGFALLQELSQFGAGSKLRVPRLRPLALEEKWLRRQHRFSGNANERNEDLEAPAVSSFVWLFDALPEVIGLYGKPTARNSQVWGITGPLAGKWILDGNSADKTAIALAREKIVEDRGTSRLQMREVFPPMELNGREVIWQRPWVAWRTAEGEVGADFSSLGEVRVGSQTLQPEVEAPPPERELRPESRFPLTYSKTVEPEEAFEKRYWRNIERLTQPGLTAKNNVDCVEDEARQKHCERNHLPDIGEHLLKPHYRTLGLDLWASAFRWEIDFPITWWGGLQSPTQQNFIVVIPGTGDHSEAIWLADHYDTAYMEDVYEGTADPDLKGHHHAAPGADDNASGTATLMEAARVLPGLKLKRDVWLVHLTGEEFPADCLGARAISERLVRNERILPDRPNPKVVGVYLLDMIAHNTDRDRVEKGKPSASIFQLSAGRGNRAEKLAELAWGATKAWNQGTRQWNASLRRKPFWERSATYPRQGLLPRYQAEVRRPEHPKSTLYNTDGQIFSDAGVPVVLFMENYDIGRVGYHDSQDTLANIDLDYGAGLARIAIESVAQAAND